MLPSCGKKIDHRKNSCSQQCLERHGTNHQVNQVNSWIFFDRIGVTPPLGVAGAIDVAFFEVEELGTRIETHLGSE